MSDRLYSVGNKFSTIMHIHTGNKLDKLKLACWEYKCNAICLQVIRDLVWVMQLLWDAPGMNMCSAQIHILKRYASKFHLVKQWCYQSIVFITIHPNEYVGCQHFVRFFVVCHRLSYSISFKVTVYPKKYAHGFCFAVLCCGYTLTDFPISIRLTSLALWQSNDCPSASKATLMNMDKYFVWIHYERLHNHNKAKHNKTVCIFLGIYCISLALVWSYLAIASAQQPDDYRLTHESN